MGGAGSLSAGDSCLHAASRKSAVIYSLGLCQVFPGLRVQIELPSLILMSPALLNAGPSVSLWEALPLHRARTEPSQISSMPPDPLVMESWSYPCMIVCASWYSERADKR